jgi:anthranilate/para-aminobenzoate synthase component I
VKAPIVELHSDSASKAITQWSCRPSAAIAWITCDAATGIATFSDTHGIQRTFSDPLSALAWMESFPLGRQPGSRWIGFLSYDLGRWFESVPSIAVDDLNLPLFVFSFHVSTSELPPRQQHRIANSSAKSTHTRDTYMTAVQRAIDYIRAGDIFQVNLSQRISLGLPAQPCEIWRRAVSQSPPRFGALLDYGDFALISLSPELFLQLDGREVITRPIKGTRPLGVGMESHLRNSVKDAAELNMIVDLERNDLGRICEIGTVQVSQPRAIEAHPTVYHGVATITGTLRPEIGLVDLLRATFPGGSITGAPKIRAMQIIEELEPFRRGPYCGAIGYLAADGSMQFNVAIRTMIAKDGLVHVPVGGGIVADSDPADEYAETLVKAQAMFNALGVTNGDLHATL